MGEGHPTICGYLGAALAMFVWKECGIVLKLTFSRIRCSSSSVMKFGM